MSIKRVEDPPRWHLESCHTTALIFQTVWGLNMLSLKPPSFKRMSKIIQALCRGEDLHKFYQTVFFLFFYEMWFCPTYSTVPQLLPPPKKSLYPIHAPVQLLLKNCKHIATGFHNFIFGSFVNMGLVFFSIVIKHKINFHMNSCRWHNTNYFLPASRYQ